MTKTQLMTKAQLKKQFVHYKTKFKVPDHKYIGMEFNGKIVDEVKRALYHEDYLVLYTDGTFEKVSFIDFHAVAKNWILPTYKEAVKTWSEFIKKLDDDRVNGGMQIFTFTNELQLARYIILTELNK